MDALLYFSLATIISFVASLQLGPVNLRVIQCTVEKSRYYAFLVGLGGSIPEILYAGLAFFITEQFNKEAFSSPWMHAITIPVFLFLAYTNFKPKKEKAKTTETHHSKGFGEGFVLALLNPQLITFWLLVIAYLKTKNQLLDATFFTQSMFVLGTATGAFLLQVTFIALAHRYKETIVNKTGKHFDSIIGGLFILLAIIDSIKLLTKLL